MAELAGLISLPIAGKAKCQPQSTSCQSLTIHTVGSPQPTIKADLSCTPGPKAGGFELPLRASSSYKRSFLAHVTSCGDIDLLIADFRKRTREKSPPKERRGAVGPAKAEINRCAKQKRGQHDPPSAKTAITPFCSDKSLRLICSEPAKSRKLSNPPFEASWPRCALYSDGSGQRQPIQAKPATR
jgi:hypothetical protein